MTVRSLWSTWSVLLLLGPILPLWATEISCRNEDGKPVDWYIIYKLPKYMRHEAAGTGLEYMFMDSLTQAWKLSKYLINLTESALGQTLQQLYQVYESKKNSTAYVMYNDGPPGKMNYSWKHGHTKATTAKGIFKRDKFMNSFYDGCQWVSLWHVRSLSVLRGFLLLDKSQGFWVIHSIPEFPPFPQKGYQYPHTGQRNGQTAICLTFQYDQFAKIDKQLLCYNPNVYNCSIPKIFCPELFNLQMLCAGSKLPPTPQKLCLTKLHSAHGENLLNFAKTHSYNEDIYLTWMAPELKTDLLVESWQRKGREFFSNCSLPYHVYNANLIQTPWNSSFSSYYDHSKWCVSRKYEDQWTCIGDLNYAPQQAKRSGGFICTQNHYIYKAFRQLVYHYYGCRLS